MSYNLSISPICPDPNLGPSLAQVCPGPQFLTFMSLFNTFALAKEEVSLLCQRFEPVEPAEYYYDFIVVGGEYSFSFFFSIVCNSLKYYNKSTKLILFCNIESTSLLSRDRSTLHVHNWKVIRSVERLLPETIAKDCPS